MNFTRTVIPCTVVLATWTAAIAAETAPVPDRAKYLLLDARIIDKTENARLAVGKVKKHPANPLFQEDKPWEPRFDNLYANVRYHGNQERTISAWAHDSG